MSWYDNGPDVPKDQRGGFVTTADVLHNVVHMGMLFEASAETIDATFDTDSNFDIVIETGEREGHFFWEADASGGRVEAILYESPTVTAATGTAITAYNKRKSATTTLLTTLLRQPTVTVVGTQCEPKRQIFATATGSNRVTASIRGLNEINLEPSTKYLMRFTAKADNVLLSVLMQIYERTVVEVDL